MSHKTVVAIVALACACNSSPTPPDAVPSVASEDVAARTSIGLPSDLRPVAAAKAPAVGMWVMVTSDRAGGIRTFDRNGTLLRATSVTVRASAGTYAPMLIGASDSKVAYHVFFTGDLLKVDQATGTTLWKIDAKLSEGHTAYIPIDIAVTSEFVYLVHWGRGTVSKYRASDGALVWRAEHKIYEGATVHTPMKVAAAGADQLYVLLGNQALRKLRTSDGAMIWTKNIPVNGGGSVGWFGDVATANGFAYVADRDAVGTIRKFRERDGGLVWSVRYSLPAYTGYVATKLAAVGDTLVVGFGDRYYATVRGVDGQLSSTVTDIGFREGSLIWAFADLVAVPVP